MKLSEILKAILDNPDDLSTLPNAVAKAEESEAAEAGYLERIGKMQELNKSYLAQIPIPGHEPEEQEEDIDVTIEDAKAQIIAQLGGH